MHYEIRYIDGTKLTIGRVIPYMQKENFDKWYRATIRGFSEIQDSIGLKAFLVFFVDNYR